MNREYFTEGYNLMMDYMCSERILTRERKFRQRLDRWYNKNKDSDVLSLEQEKEFIQLEQYFFNNIAPAPSNTHDQAAVNFLNIVADVDYDNINKNKESNKNK